jgi:hypothetical protein
MTNRKIQQQIESRVPFGIKILHNLRFLSAEFFHLPKIFDFVRGGDGGATTDVVVNKTVGIF